MVPTDVIDRIRAMAEAGRSSREIGNAVGRSTGSIQYICLRYDIELRCRPGNKGGGAWSEQRRAAFNAMRADPERYEHWRNKQPMFGSEPGDEVRNCAPGAWREALGDRRYEDVPQVEPETLPLRLPRPDIAAGMYASSMAWCA